MKNVGMKELKRVTLGMLALAWKGTYV